MKVSRGARRDSQRPKRGLLRSQRVSAANSLFYRPVDIVAGPSVSFCTRQFSNSPTNNVFSHTDCLSQSFNTHVRFADQSYRYELCELCAIKTQLCVLSVPFVVTGTSIHFQRHADVANARTAGDV